MYVYIHVQFRSIFLSRVILQLRELSAYHALKVPCMYVYIYIYICMYTYTISWHFPKARDFAAAGTHCIPCSESPLHACMYVCVCVCIYIYIHIHIHIQFCSIFLGRVILLILQLRELSACQILRVPCMYVCMYVIVYIYTIS
jgi:hypothetical protein